jgi:NADH-quinone oxidoreductase subunit J
VVDLVFYALALGAVLCAAGVVLARSPIASVLSLLGCFFCMALIYLVSGFQFLAAIQILVYGGAVMVLFLFVVMLLNLGDADAASSSEPIFHPGPRVTASLAVALGALGALLLAIVRTPLVFPRRGFGLPEAGLDPVPALAAAMFSRYSLPFEAASVLLLATAVGVMVLAKRQRRAAQARPAGASMQREEAA